MEAELLEEAPGGSCLMKAYIKKAYDKCVIILNNGNEYEFYTRPDRRPTKIMLALNTDYLEFAQMNNKKFIDNDDFAELWDLIEKDDKPFGLNIDEIGYDKFTNLRGPDSNVRQFYRPSKFQTSPLSGLS